MKFQTEQDSIDFFTTQLTTSGFTNINATQSLDKYSFYDVYADYKNKKCKFELKRRDKDSTDFGDSVIEMSKYANFLNEIVNGQIDQGYVVSFFNDIYTIDSILNTHTIKSYQANQTTEFENRKKVDKWFVCYNQEKKFKYNS